MLHSKEGIWLTAFLSGWKTILLDESFSATDPGSNGQLRDVWNRPWNSCKEGWLVFWAGGGEEWIDIFNKHSSQASKKAITTSKNKSLIYISLQLKPPIALLHSTILRLYSIGSDVSLDLKRLRDILSDDSWQINGRWGFLKDKERWQDGQHIWLWKEIKIHQRKTLTSDTVKCIEMFREQKLQHIKLFRQLRIN